MKPGNPSIIAREFMRTGHSHACPIIDMHGHFGPFPGAYLPAARTDKMLSTLRRAGVKRIVCSAHEALLGDYRRGNREMQAAISAHPGILSGYWGINPNYAGSWQKAERDFEHSRGFVGFKFLPDYHAYPLNGTHYEPSLAYADANSLPVLIHTWGGSAFNSPQLIEKVAHKYTRAALIMGHSGYGDWDTALRVARDYANVYLELTAVYVAHDFSMLPSGSGTPSPLGSCLQVSGIIERMVTVATSKKIVFGTDLPWYSPHFAAGAVLFARITENDRHDILHRNAGRLLTRTGLILK